MASRSFHHANAADFTGSGRNDRQALPVSAAKPANPRRIAGTALAIGKGGNLGE
jgi:hypothetical protein